VAGWSETKNAPVRFINEKNFRPFMTVWNGGGLFAAGSIFSYLGYKGNKSYGVTFSPCPRCVQGASDLRSVLIGNSFTNMYTGFSSYQSEGIIAIGNTYKDNIIHGISLHEGSRRLIIADNDIGGSRQNHGLSLAGEVKDSVIFRNKIHDNAGSGLVLERTCTGNILSGNVSAVNKGDGVSVFESTGNSFWGNRIYKNKSAGIRVRNSKDILLAGNEVTDNEDAPFVVYATSEVAIQDSLIKASPHKAAFKIENVERVSISNTKILSDGDVIANKIFADERGIRENIGEPDKIVVIEEKRRGR
jgi:poly(beta-D-mannuronate) C5 epimerase